MFLHACCYGEDVGVKDYVIRVELQPLNQQVVRPFADSKFAFSISCLVFMELYCESEDKGGEKRKEVKG